MPQQIEAKRLVFPDELERTLFPEEREIVNKLVPKMDRQFRQNMTRLFQSSGASGGSRWAPLKPRYRKWKERTWGRRPILVASGEMRESLNRARNSEHIARWDRSSKQIQLGTKNIKAAYHSPSPERRANFPARDPIQHTDAQADEYQRILVEFLKARFERAVRVLRQLAKLRAAG